MTSFSISDRRTSRRIWVLCIGLIAAILAGLGLLIWSIDRAGQPASDFRARFDRLRGLDTEWDKEILSLQLGMAPNYDAVTNAARDLKLELRALMSVSAHRPSLAPLVEPLETFARTIDRKDVLSERIKASYAMLRNSVAVLPAAITDAYDDPEIVAPVPGLAGADKRTADLLTETITAMVGFITTPTPLLQQTVTARIAAAREATGALPPELAQTVERFLVQIEVVIRERARSNDLMVAVTALDSERVAGRVESELQTLEAASASLQRRLSDLAILLAGGLVLTLVATAFLLWRRFSRLSRDNVLLKQANADAEEQLVQSAKLSSLGQMVAGITHEINTPLAYVKAVFELIKERVLASPELLETPRGLQEPEDEAERAAAREWREDMTTLLDDGLHGLEEIATLVRTMKNFSRLDKGHVESVSVEETIDSALLLARAKMDPAIEVRQEFGSVPPIMASASQLRQVLLNLIVNAAEAIGENGQGAASGVLELRTRLTASDMVQIDVSDNGPGIAPDDLARVFDPFFTTKAVGEGTGMGLSICHRIVENHGGTIAVNSQPGRGTVFTVTLPRQGGPVPGSSEDASKDADMTEGASGHGSDASRAA
ncbi:ATP-binding protein [Breoghania sp. JC706]|uniref:ATP-binding protein n=1 Tax=Breoghania sp. JC706 TaxID=3117732 RepID=UPI00300BAB20